LIAKSYSMFVIQIKKLKLQFKKINIKNRYFVFDRLKSHK